MRQRRGCVWMAACVGLVASAAAQDDLGSSMDALAADVGQLAGSAGELVDRMFDASWSDAELREVGRLLAGSWITAEPVDSAASDEVRMVMHVVPVSIVGMEHTLYVEQSREDQPWAPHRQAIFELYRFDGGARLRTLEFQLRDGKQAGLFGMWLRPDLMPAIDAADLIATLDAELTRDGGGFVARTPYAYPTRVGGAVQMTSTSRILPDRLEVVDRGIGADGSLAWGADAGEPYVFERYASPMSYESRDGGLGVITYGQELGGEPIAEGDRVSFQYSGYLQWGFEFDSSRREGRVPMTYVLPGRLIKGWQDGVAGMRAGERRRLVIPPELGYGARGNLQARIGGTDTLHFDIEVVNVEETEFSDGGAAGPGSSE